MKYKRYPTRAGRHLLSAPFIYGVSIPIVILDIAIEMYHRICFPLYGIPYVSRSKYIRMDRHKLSYLTGMEKINCLYCGYVNGLFAYFVQIAGETEKYWCSIKHNKTINDTFTEPAHHQDFMEYGDEKAYREHSTE